MRGCIAIVLLIVGCFALPSCKEGCKDNTALNFNTKAKVENGTCLYCKTKVSKDSASFIFTDFNAPFPYNQSGTFQLIVGVVDSASIGNGCKSYGLNLGDRCQTYLRMINLTNKTASGRFDVTFTQNGFNVWFFNDTSNFIQIAPGASINFGMVDTACSDVVAGSLSGDFNGGFSYF